MRLCYLLFVPFALLLSACYTSPGGMVTQAEYDMRTGDLINAERRSLLGYGAAERAGDELVMADALFVMINVDCMKYRYLYDEHAQGILDLCAKALEHYRNANSPAGEAVVYYKRATLYFEMGKRDLACSDLSAALKAYDDALLLDPAVFIPVFVEGYADFHELIVECQRQMGCFAESSRN